MEGDSKRRLLCKITYALFFLGRTHMAGAKQLWAAKAPLKHKMHLWLAMRDRLWTSDRLARRRLQHSPVCPLCYQEPETIEHLTIQCSYSREVWYHLLLARRLHRHTPAAHDVIHSWWKRLQEGTLVPARREVNTLMILVTRELWLERNARTFDKVAVLPMELCRRIIAEFEQWKRTGLWGSAANNGFCEV
jgi:hypothetical protein